VVCITTAAFSLMVTVAPLIV